jgi:hypothetical protein
MDHLLIGVINLRDWREGMGFSVRKTITASAVALSAAMLALTTTTPAQAIGRVPCGNNTVIIKNYTDTCFAGAGSIDVAIYEVGNIIAGYELGPRVLVNVTYIDNPGDPARGVTLAPGHSFGADDFEPGEWDPIHAVTRIIIG